LISHIIITVFLLRYIGYRHEMNVAGISAGLSVLFVPCASQHVARWVPRDGVHCRNRRHFAYELTRLDVRLCKTYIAFHTHTHTHTYVNGSRVSLVYTIVTQAQRSTYFCCVLRSSPVCDQQTHMNLRFTCLHPPARLPSHAPFNTYDVNG
jgi:hypothetical protein